MNTYEREKYNLRYEWVVEVWKPTIANGAIKWTSPSSHLKPWPLHVAIETLLRERTRHHNPFRIRNIVTGEIIPGEIFV